MTHVSQRYLRLAMAFNDSCINESRNRDFPEAILEAYQELTGATRIHLAGLDPNGKVLFYHARGAPQMVELYRRYEQFDPLKPDITPVDRHGSYFRFTSNDFEESARENPFFDMLKSNVSQLVATRHPAQVIAVGTWAEEGRALSELASFHALVGATLVQSFISHARHFLPDFLHTVVEAISSAYGSRKVLLFDGDGSCHGRSKSAAGLCTACFDFLQQAVQNRKAGNGESADGNGSSAGRPSLVATPGGLRWRISPHTLLDMPFVLVESYDGLAGPALDSGCSVCRTTSTEFVITPRERAVAFLAASGETNREISQRLNISVETVKRHLYSIYQKLDVRNRVEMANAIRNKPSDIISV